MFISYTIENYIDPNSGNECEVFSVSIDGNKIYERDYGSCTEGIVNYIDDYKNYTHETETSRRNH
jgi:hypothetical protein